MFLSLKCCAICLIALMIVSALGAANAQKLPERTEIADKSKWDLIDIYPSDTECEAELNRMQSTFPQLKIYRTEISKSPDSLLVFYHLTEDLGRGSRTPLCMPGYRAIKTPASKSSSATRIASRAWRLRSEKLRRGLRRSCMTAV